MGRVFLLVVISVLGTAYHAVAGNEPQKGSAAVALAGRTSDSYFDTFASGGSVADRLWMNAVTEAKAASLHSSPIIGRPVP